MEFQDFRLLLFSVIMSNHIGKKSWNRLTRKQKLKIINDRKNGRKTYNGIMANKKNKTKNKVTTTTTTVTTVTTTTSTTATKRVYDGYVVDRSGSMSSIWDATIKGINEYLTKSKLDAEKLGLESFFSLLWFDHELVKQYDNTKLTDVPTISGLEFPPRGSTALNDAVAKMINDLKAKLGKDAASDDVDVTITIFTDGYENASQEFRGVGNRSLKALIEEVQNKLKWTVTYVGAGTQEQALNTALQYGFFGSNVASYVPTAGGAAAVFATMANARSVKSALFSNNLKSNSGYFTTTKVDPDTTTTTTDTTTN